MRVRVCACGESRACFVAHSVGSAVVPGSQGHSLGCASRVRTSLLHKIAHIIYLYFVSLLRDMRKGRAAGLRSGSWRALRRSRLFAPHPPRRPCVKKQQSDAILIASCSATRESADVYVASTQATSVDGTSRELLDWPEVCKYKFLPWPN